MAKVRADVYRDEEQALKVKLKANINPFMQGQNPTCLADLFPNKEIKEDMDAFERQRETEALPKSIQEVPME
jgi:hypothetical protein